VGLLRGCVAKLIEIDEWFGYREKKWGVVTGRWDGGCGSRLVGWCVPNLGMFMVRARWSLWLVSEVVMVASVGCNCVVGGRRSIQWSSGEFVGMHVGVRGSPTWVSEVVLQSFSRGA